MDEPTEADDIFKEVCDYIEAAVMDVPDSDYVALIDRIKAELDRLKAERVKTDA